MTRLPRNARIAATEGAPEALPAQAASTMAATLASITERTPRYAVVRRGLTSMTTGLRLREHEVHADVAAQPGSASHARTAASAAARVPGDAPVGPPSRYEKGRDVRMHWELTVNATARRPSANSDTLAARPRT